MNGYECTSTSECVCVCVAGWAGSDSGNKSMSKRQCSERRRWNADIQQTYLTASVYQSGDNDNIKHMENCATSRVESWESRNEFQSSILHIICTCDARSCCCCCCCVDHWLTVYAYIMSLLIA